MAGAATRALHAGGSDIDPLSAACPIEGLAACAGDSGRCKPGAVITEASDRLIRLALAEDIGTGDRTTLVTIPADARCRARVYAKQALVMAGGAFFTRVFRHVDPDVTVTQLVADGTPVTYGEDVLRLEGPAHAILVGERTALNILQRLCGTATLTARFVAAIEGTGAKVTDTRKTTPGMRQMQKHAVAAAGGANHRFGLDSGVLIKDNHIAACGSLTATVERARDLAPHPLRIEVEVTTLEELDEAIAAEADIVLLDNMDTPTMAEAVARIRASPHRMWAEASGNLSLERIREAAETGVDYLSVGALTHSAVAADLSLEVLPS